MSEDGAIWTTILAGMKNSGKQGSLLQQLGRNWWNLAQYVNFFDFFTSTELFLTEKWLLFNINLSVQSQSLFTYSILNFI